VDERVELVAPALEGGVSPVQEQRGLFTDDPMLPTRAVPKGVEAFIGAVHDLAAERDPERGETRRVRHP